MKLGKILIQRSVGQLTRVAAVLALLALAIVVSSIVYPRPLLVVFAMSVGHVIGGAAFACYLIAVLVDVSRSNPRADSLAPTSNKAPSETISN
jgi:hypothetical protein